MPVVAGPIREVGSQFSVHADALIRVPVIRGKRRGIIHHRPRLRSVVHFGLPNAPALVTAVHTLVVPEVGEASIVALRVTRPFVTHRIQLVPAPVLVGGLRPDNVLIDTPLASRPPNYHIGGALI